MMRMGLLLNGLALFALTSMHVAAIDASKIPLDDSQYQQCVAPVPANLNKAKALSGKAATWVGTTTHSVDTFATDAAYAYTNNDAVREVTAAFYQRNPDVYDFIFIFTNFEFDVPANVAGYYTPVRNSVTGIGLSPLDTGVAYGSGKQLQGVIDMRWNTSHSFNRADPRFASLMKLAAHAYSGHEKPPFRTMRSQRLLAERDG